MRILVFCAVVVAAAIISLAGAAAWSSDVLADYQRAADTLKEREARGLIARVAGIELKTEAVKVREILPQGSTAIVVAQIETAFRFTQENGKWQVKEIRTGDNKWEDVNLLIVAINAEKTARVQAELAALATALAALRRERGSYVVSKDHARLIDYLSPRYITRVIRVDPWHKPYAYEGTSDRYSLRSNGADGVAGTADDIIKSSD